MLKDLNTRREVLSGHTQGISLDRIRRITGVPETTVKRIIDQSKASGLPIEQILQLPDAEFENLVEPSCRTRMLYIEPDWELVYLNHERPSKALLSDASVNFHFDAMRSFQSKEGKIK